MDAAVENFQPVAPGTLPDTSDHILRQIQTADGQHMLEIGGCDRGRAADIAARGGRYACLLHQGTVLPANFPENATVIQDDPDWWCGDTAGVIDVALIVAAERIRRFDQLLEVLWHDLHRDARLIVADLCVARPQPPRGDRYPRTASQLYSSLTYSGFTVTSMEDTRDGVVVGALRK